MATILTGLCVAVAVGVATFKIMRKKTKSVNGCGDCSGCSGCSHG